MSVRLTLRIVFSLAVGLVDLSCASHVFILESVAPTRTVEKIYVQNYFVFGLVPQYPIKKQSDYCGPHEHIYSINRYDGGLPSFAVCTLTLFIYCPELMGIACAPDVADQST